MAALAVVLQSDDDRPYVTVGTDTNGGVCWVVVGMGKRVRCYSGERAIAVLRMMLASRGIPTP